MACCLYTHHMHLLCCKEMKTRQTFILLKTAITKTSDEFSIFSERKIGEGLLKNATICYLFFYQILAILEFSSEGSAI